ncbi:MAG TPA: twin-arginine translocase subunit TatC [bacterium]
MTEPRTDSSPTLLPLSGHLGELRRRLIIVLTWFAVVSGFAFTHVERILEWLQRPAPAYLGHFAYFSPTEALFAYIKVSVLAGLVCTVPVALAQLWGFVRSGLTARERSWGRAFVGWGTALFVAGVSFAYWVLLPMSLRFLMGIGRAQLEPVISIERYLSFVMTLIVWCGFVFELPVVLFILAKANIVTAEWLRQQRPYAFLVLVILAAVITPTTDVVNLTLMTLPLVGLYELSILVTRIALPRQPETSDQQPKQGVTGEK